MSKSAHINFKLNFKTWEFGNIELPIELRKLDLALVDKTLSSNPVNIEPGDYIVSTIFPAGQEISRVVKVLSGNNDISIEPPPGMESPHESHESVHFFNQDLNSLSLTSLRAPFGEESVLIKRAGLNFLKGNPLSGTVVPLPDVKNLVTAHRIGDEFLQYDIQGSREHIFAQFIQDGQPPLNIALPVGISEMRIGCKLIVVPNNDTYNISVQLDNLEANLLLRYREEGCYDQINVVSNSKKNDPEKLLKQKGSDPIAAAVGAYTILKFDSVDRLHTWTVNLRNWFEWLPDGAAICGEHFARVGEDRLALESFLMLEQRGLPYFSDGLSYALSRLRNYLGNWKRHFGPDYSMSKAKNLMQSLEKFEQFVDFKKPVLTFPSGDLRHPDSLGWPANPLFDFEIGD